MFLINKNRPFITNAEIIEWDIRSADTSIIEYFNLMDQKKIDKLNKLSKSKRNRAVGILRQNKEFSKNLENGFKLMVKKFIEENNLEEWDILSIKRDAVFVVNTDIRIKDIGCVHFIPKNTYFASIIIPRYEFYIPWNNTIDVKGISDECLEFHKDGILSFIRTIIDLYGSGNSDNKIALHQYLAEFVQRYKEKQLPLEYYRKFDSYSQFEVDYGDGNLALRKHITESDLDDLNILFNYQNVILPIMQLFV